MNVDKERVFESCEIAHGRERVQGWKHLTLILQFSGAKMHVIVSVFGSFTIGLFVRVVAAELTSFCKFF